ncbi:MAG: HIT domain-containing protein [Gemmatimonadales bacterium]|nr:MAG: HIT domain-containing protein [Gemmatimonadales bacterium]
MTDIAKDECIFCRIVAGDIPAEVIHQDEEILAFRDNNAQAPTHILLIPREHVSSVAELDTSQESLAGRLLLGARSVAESEGLVASGYRLVVNHGADGGQSVGHLHLHLLGGRPLGWPPG